MSHNQSPAAVVARMIGPTVHARCRNPPSGPCLAWSIPQWLQRPSAMIQCTPHRTRRHPGRAQVRPAAVQPATGHVPRPVSNCRRAFTRRWPGVGRMRAAFQVVVSSPIVHPARKLEVHPGLWLPQARTRVHAPPARERPIPAGPVAHASGPVLRVRQVRTTREANRSPSKGHRIGNRLATGVSIQVRTTPDPATRPVRQTDRVHRALTSAPATSAAVVLSA